MPRLNAEKVLLQAHERISRARKVLAEMDLPVLGHATEANDEMREGQLWLPDGPGCPAWAVLRVGSHEGRQARSPIRLARAGPGVAPGHRQLPQREEALAHLGDRNRARPRHPIPPQPLSKAAPNNSRAMRPEMRVICTRDDSRAVGKINVTQ